MHDLKYNGPIFPPIIANKIKVESKQDLDEDYAWQSEREFRDATINDTWRVNTKRKLELIDDDIEKQDRKAEFNVKRDQLFRATVSVYQLCILLHLTED